MQRIFDALQAEEIIAIHGEVSCFSVNSAEFPNVEFC